MTSPLRERSFTVGDDWQRTNGGLFLPPTVSKKAKYGPWPLAVDLFCGAGGFSCGMHQAGFRTVAAADSDGWATRTFLCNLGTYPSEIHGCAPGDLEALNAEWEKATKTKKGIVPMPLSGDGWIKSQIDGPPGCPHFFYGDIRQLSGQTILDTLGLDKGDIDVVVGGPPCQGFSIAGKRDVMDPRNSLVFEFARLILELGPKAFVMENVKGISRMRTPEGLPVVDALARILSDGGFGTMDAIKGMLLASSGAGAALANSKVDQLKAEEDEESHDAKQPVQLGLL